MFLFLFCFVDYIAALSSQSNYAEPPYAAYSSRKRQQLAAAQAHHSRQRRKDDRLSNPIAERPEREVRTGPHYMGNLVYGTGTHYMENRL